MGSMSAENDAKQKRVCDAINAGLESHGIAGRAEPMGMWSIMLWFGDDPRTAHYNRIKLPQTEDETGYVTVHI